MKIVHFLTRLLEREGVRHVFGIHGSALSALIDEVTHESDITPILVRHEEGGAFMADGYARFSGTLGVCWGTSGPGTTNLLTGLATSYTDAVPVLAITGQVPVNAFYRGAFQESTSSGVDSICLLRGVTKFAEMITHPEQAPVLIKKALRLAQTGRKGPTALVVPRDVWGAEVETFVPNAYSYRVGNRCFDIKWVARAAELLAKAERPLILAGTGVSFSNANQELIRIAAELGAAVVTTPKAKGCFPEDHELSLGVLGLAGHPSAARFFLEEADLVLAVGSSLGQISTLDFHPRLGELPLVQVDIDPHEIGKNYPVKIGLVGDAQVVLRELARALAPLPRPSPTSRKREYIASYKAANPRVRDPELLLRDTDPILPQRAIVDLRAVLPRDAIVFMDSGNHTLWGIHYFEAYEPRTFTLSPNFGAMGYGVAASVGAQLACPERVVVSICGDGGFLMNGMEVSTAVNHGIPVIWVVLNNASLGMVYHGDRVNLGRDSGGLIRDVDLVSVARGLGAAATRVSTSEGLKAAVRRALSDRVPSLIDVTIDPDQVPPTPQLRPELRGVP